jgi:hypothetical protein
MKPPFKIIGVIWYSCIVAKMVLCTLTLQNTAVEAGEHNRPVVSAWGHFGEVTMHFTHPDTNEAGFVRVVAFENWDLLVEVHQASRVKKLLQLHTPTVSAYYGLTDEELSSSSKNPFMFFGYALAPALGPLMSAFPDGIKQVPYTETTFKRIYERKPFRGTVVRMSMDEIKYDNTTSENEGGQPFRCYGTWKSVKATPLPDDFSFYEWKFASNSTAAKMSVRTLGELRRALATSTPASLKQSH